MVWFVNTNGQPSRGNSMDLLRQCATAGIVEKPYNLIIFFKQILKIQHIQDIQLFVQTARLGSISAAARQSDQTPATASAALKRLERQLGCSLLIRSTRSLKLTTQGELYLQYCQNALSALQQGEQALADSASGMNSWLRLAAPSDLGRNWLPALLDQLQAQWPQLQIRLELSDRVAGLQREAVDVALRYGQQHDPALVVLPIAQIPRVVVAAPAYLARYGQPQSPMALVQHNSLLYQIDERTFDRWRFQTPQGELSVNVSGNRISNDADLVRRWCVAGHGIALKSALDMADDLRHQRVQVLLRDTPCPALQLSLVCANRHQITPAVQQLRQLLQQAVEQTLATINLS